MNPINRSIKKWLTSRRAPPDDGPDETNKRFMEAVKPIAEKVYGDRFNGIAIAEDNGIVSLVLTEKFMDCMTWHVKIHTGKDAKKLWTGKS